MRVAGVYDKGDAGGEEGGPDMWMSEMAQTEWSAGICLIAGVESIPWTMEKLSLPSPSPEPPPAWPQPRALVRALKTRPLPPCTWNQESRPKDEAFRLSFSTVPTISSQILEMYSSICCEKGCPIVDVIHR